MQFIFSVLVILLHSNRVFYNDVFHFTQKSIFSRLAVPFFLICSASFYKRKARKEGYFKRSIVQYIWWSFFYLPLGYGYFMELALPMIAAPLAVIVGMIYSGVWYHLWYIPAYLFGVFLVNKLKQYFSMRIVLMISLALYITGSIETYSGYLQNTILLEGYQLYRTVFLTSRNGLFYVPVFVCAGYIIASEEQKGLFSEYFYKRKLCLSLVLLCLEGSIIYFNQGIDKNFMLSFIPVTLFLFIWAKNTSIWMHKNLHILKQLSIYYFFIHPIFIELANLFSKDLSEKIGVHSGWVVFLSTLAATHLTSLVLIKFNLVERISWFSNTRFTEKNKSYLKQSQIEIE
ncbi:acyltransferase family protein [Marinilactibacillus sp. Marseille-P9653]|uniref:acyltransferase family protein n=1 Tax=Marinilactibacillus sp. Marseille-P9653 TaxID=2866583 RepID=UPI001CE42FC8|nr:acyltransferase family protein [Marinilactibacillus sp. Marseille-P9653]